MDLGRSPGSLIEAHDLYRFFHAADDETFALRGVSISADEGMLVAVIGASGSGKSTLLSCLAGLDEPDGGFVVVVGDRITRRPEEVRARIRARGIGVLQQSGNLLDHLTVAQNVHLARSMARRRGGQPVDELLASVGLAGRSSARPRTLSGGEAARAGLAVALANDPPVLIADEPSGEVDDENEDRLLSLLRGRAERGAAVVVATHSERITDAADRVFRLTDGRIDDG